MKLLPGFAVILNRIRYSGPLPIELSPELFFDHATEAEALQIAQFIMSGGFKPFGDIHYYTAIPREPGDVGTYTYQHVPLREVRFWVLRSESIQNLHKWEQPFQLLDCEIEWGAILYNQARNVDAPKIFHFFQSHLSAYYTDVSEADFERVKEIKGQLDSMDTEHANMPAAASLLRIIDNFRASRAYIRLGHMALLSHFTILEGLLTHNPKGMEDSLNHQLSTKIPLLFRRIPNPPDHLTYFSGIAESGKLWKKLYAVRSAIAHGNDFDLANGELQSLRDFELVQNYVLTSLKALVRIALREPQLVFDLRAC